MVLRTRREAAALRLAWLAALDTHVGRLDAGLPAAPARGGHLLNMKSDWKVIFPFELDR